jgi:hypothetical protein
MMSLAETVAADVAEVLGDTEGPGEACRYVVAGTGRSRPVRAILHRRQMDEQTGEMDRIEVGQAQAIVTRAEVPVSNIGDELHVRVGPAEERWKVDSIARESPAVRVLEIRRMGARSMVPSGAERMIT